MLTGAGRLPTLEIARSGFRLARERPWLIAAWGLASFVFNVVGSLLASASAGPAITRILDMVQHANPDPNAAEPLLAQVAPAYAVLLTGGLVLNAFYLAAANRALGPPGGQGASTQPPYVGLARDALLQFGLLLILTAIGLGVVLALLLVSTVLGDLLAPALARLVGMAVALSGFVYVWLRLSLASPAAFAAGRIDLAHAWALTSGRALAIARAYLLVLLLAAVVYLLGAVAIDMGMSAAFGGERRLEALTRLDFSAPAALLTPARLSLAALQAVLSGLVLPVLICPPIAIYRALSFGVRPAPSTPAATDSPWG